MTVEQLAAQMIWAGWGDEKGGTPTSYDDHARFLVEDLQVGGLVLFARNIESPEQVARLTAELQSHAATPLLIGVDQEGGRVCRLQWPGFTFVGNRALGVIDEEDTTRAVARAIGEQLSALGFNLDFAPVLDVNNNPRNPVIGVRSYGEDPETVSRHGIAALEGLRDAGVLSVVKHFPGHGDTGQDSHFELPTLNVSRERLEEVELAPFRAAIAAHAPIVMTTHIVFPALDPDLPSTLSPTILTSLLRGELGFKGLIVTDCMEMRGIADHWGPEEAAVLAVEAGADVLSVCHTRDVQKRMRDALCDAVRSGRLTEERLRESVARQQQVRETLPLATGDVSQVGAERYRDLEKRVSERSLALVGNVEPSVWSRDTLITVSGEKVAVERTAAALIAAGFRADAAPWPRKPETLAKAKQLLWMTLPDGPFEDGVPPADLREMLRTHPRAAILAVREHYCLQHYPDNQPRLAAWGTRESNLRAVARWLVGEVRATGRV